MTKFYYTIPSERALVDHIENVCDVFPSKRDRIILLFATAFQETDFATYPDKTEGKAGEGVFQFDPGNIEDVLERTSYGGGKKYRDKLIELKDIDVSVAKHETLRYMTAVSTALTALKYYIVPRKLPKYDDFDGMWCYYKKYYNSIKGKATQVDFLGSYDKALILYQKYFGNKKA